MNKLNKEQIKDLLPHREPMLLIDELYDIKKLTSATGVVIVKKDSFFVQGHFPGQPVMPGVLIVEAFGQTAAALTAHGRVWKYKGDAFVDDKKMADAIWSATIVDKK